MCERFWTLPAGRISGWPSPNPRAYCCSPLTRGACGSNAAWNDRVRRSQALMDLLECHSGGVLRVVTGTLQVSWPRGGYKEQVCGYVRHARVDDRSSR